MNQFIVTVLAAILAYGGMNPIRAVAQKPSSSSATTGNQNAAANSARPAERAGTQSGNNSAPGKSDAAKDEKPDKADVHEFIIKNFRTEGGVTLPEARIVYGTYGQLNAARDNVVLLPSHYMADHRGYEWLIASERALDPDKLPGGD